MRIVELDEFRSLKPGTIFMKYSPQIFGELMVFQGVTGDVDFIYESLADEIECGGSTELFDLISAAEKDSRKSLPLDFHCTARDGMYESDQLFAVYEDKDIAGLISKLEECRSMAYAI